MSLLFDENLSWRLVKRLADVYPGSRHVNQLALERGSDELIWQKATDEGLAIVSKDDDFRQRAMVFGAPPKTVWLRLGNASTGEIEAVLRHRHGDIRAFLANDQESMLVLQAAG